MKLRQQELEKALLQTSNMQAQVMKYFLSLLFLHCVLCVPDLLIILASTDRYGYTLVSQQAMNNRTVPKGRCCNDAPIVITIHGSEQHMTHEEVVCMPAEQFGALWKVRVAWL